MYTAFCARIDTFSQYNVICFSTAVYLSPSPSGGRSAEFSLRLWSPYRPKSLFNSLTISMPRRCSGELSVNGTMEQLSLEERAFARRCIYCRIYGECKIVDTRLKNFMKRDCRANFQGIVAKKTMVDFVLGNNVSDCNWQKVSLPCFGRKQMVCSATTFSRSNNLTRLLFFNECTN